MHVVLHTLKIKAAEFSAFFGRLQGIHHELIDELKNHNFLAINLYGYAI
jgi:hypothetical protein